MLAVDIIKANTKTAWVTHRPRLNGGGATKRPPTAVCVHSMTFGDSREDPEGVKGSSPSQWEEAPSLVCTYHVKRKEEVAGKTNRLLRFRKRCFADGGIWKKKKRQLSIASEAAAPQKTTGSWHETSGWGRSHIPTVFNDCFSSLHSAGYLRLLKADIHAENHPVLYVGTCVCMFVCIYLCDYLLACF